MTTNINRYTLAGFLDGTFTRTTDLTLQPNTGKPVVTFVREGLSGTYLTMEYCIPQSVFTSQERNVSGTISLSDLQDPTSVTHFPITFEIYNGSLLVETKTVNASASGAYSFTTLVTGSSTIRAKASHWLASLSNPVNLSSNVSNLNCTLANGDVDNDNSVSILDYIKLSVYFDATDVDSNWNTADSEGVRPKDADLDNDSAVSILDYIVLSTNYELQGDSAP